MNEKCAICKKPVSIEFGTDEIGFWWTHWVIPTTSYWISLRFLFRLERYTCKDSKCIEEGKKKRDTNHAMREKLREYGF